MVRSLLVMVCALITLFWAHPVPCSENSPQISSRTVWTLRQAVQHALAHNPDAEAARERIRQAQATLDQARASLYPQLSASGGYTRTDNPMLSFGNILNQGQFSDAIDFNKPGTTDSLFAQIMLRYQLYNGGRDSAVRCAAEKQSEATAQQARATTEQLGFEVIRAYHTIVQAEANMAARSAALASLQAALRTAQARYGEGTMLKEEVLALEVEQASAEEALLQARHSERLARRGLALLLGEQPGAEDVQLAAPSWAADGQEEQEVPGNVAPVQRPELIAMQLLVASQKEVLKQARADRYPSVELFGSYQVEQGTTMDEGSGDSWSAGLRLNQTLFDGQSTRAAITREEARLAELVAQQRKLELALAMEAEQARLGLEQESEKLVVNERRLHSAQESTRLTRLRFQEGLCTSAELIDAEKRLAEAETGFALARHARLIAVAQLKRSYGLPQFDDK
ncbi:MAG: TolC family protein [Desulfobulbaceae bacterium]|nr:TolC family protein [Desulfobulbaceae bacterium]